MTHGTDSIDSPIYGTFGNGSGRSPEPEPQYSLKMFGEVVKTFRKRARLTQEQFAPLVGYSLETVASVEQGRRLPPPDFAERADSILDAFGVILAAAKHLTRRKGLASWFRQWAELELSALSLYTYECRLIPGLLQTAAYARTLFADQLPPLADEQIEAQLAARLERQQLLRERPNTSFSFILEEHLFSGTWAVRRSPGNCSTTSSTCPSCATSTSRSCRWCGITTRGCMGRCSCWRRRITSGSATWKVRSTGSSSPTPK